MPGSIPNVDRTNPFCAARLRPGTIDFIFEPGNSLDRLVDVLQSNAWRGQIAGGHGTGKSTLLAALMPAIEKRGRSVTAITLAAGRRNLPREFFASLRLAADPPVAVVDGFEQLHLWNRFLLKRFCLVHSVGLVVASHRTASLSTLYQTTVDEPRGWRVVQRLQDGFPPRIQLADVVARLARREGNLREALFDLYDLYEQRSRT
jgi:hypothetical protein